MSQAVDYRSLDLPLIRAKLQQIVALRREKRYAEADRIRAELLALDSGMRICLTPEKATLWHVPEPPHADIFHYLNYPDFIANSREVR